MMCVVCASDLHMSMNKLVNWKSSSAAYATMAAQFSSALRSVATLWYVQIV